MSIFLNRLALYEQEPQKPEPIKWIGLGARERNVVGETIELFLHFVGKSNHCTTFTRRWMEIAIHTESSYRYRRSGFPLLFWGSIFNLRGERMRKIKERENGISETEKYCQKKAATRRKMSADELVNRIDLNAAPWPSPSNDVSSVRAIYRKR